MSTAWWVSIALGIALVRAWWIWRKSDEECSRLRRKPIDDGWSRLIEHELTRSHQLVKTMYEGQFSLNEDYLRVLEDREKMRTEVAARTYEIWMLEEKCKQQQIQIEKLGGHVLSRSSSIYKPS